MVYVIVQKNSNGDYQVTKTISSPLNVRGVVTGITWGDIRVLTLEQRMNDCIWTQEDVYVGTGEFMVFDNLVTTFDDVTGVVTNTYNYVLMDLDLIRADLTSRVDSRRDNLYYAGFTFNGKNFNSGISNRSNIQLMMLNALVDEANFPSNLVWDTTEGEQIPMDLATFKAFVSALADFTRNLFITARSIKAAIADATDYDSIRAAATWGDEPL